MSGALKSSRGARLAWSAGLLVLLAVAIFGPVDRYATQLADGLFSKALTTYAITRSLNGVISVAQGTEIAVQPVGVGLTISAGEILDPLNDLVERFSVLVLAACASLGVQLLLTEMFSTLWISIALAILVGLALLALWSERLPGRTTLIKLGVASLGVRFLFVGVTLLGALLNQAFLSERQEQALHTINTVTMSLKEEDGTPQLPTAPAPEVGLIESLDNFFTGQRQKLDIQARLDAMASQAEQAIAALINLIVVFVMQTIVLPLGLLWLALHLFKLLWRATPNGH